MKWTKIHNIYRCMHDAKAVEWSEPVAADAVTEFRNQRPARNQRQRCARWEAGERMTKAPLGGERGDKCRCIALLADYPCT